MKVLIFSTQHHGVISTYVLEQANALARYGIEIVYCGIAGRGVIGYLSAFFALRRKIRAYQPDLIHAHYGLTGLVACLATRLQPNYSRPISSHSTTEMTDTIERGRRKLQVPVVVTYHGSDINIPSVLRFSKIAMRLARWNIFVSERSQAIALQAAKGITNYSIIPCGVDLTEDQLTPKQVARHTLNLPEKEKIILFAGAFSNAVKDYHLATSVVDMLRHKEGMEPSTQEVSAQESVLMVSKKSVQRFDDLRLMEMKGYTRHEVNLLLSAADCLLLTSKTEGSPQVIKEAMACGCPIVSVDVGDVAERIRDISGCFLSHTRDPKDIAHLLQQALAFEGRTQGRQRIIELSLSNDQVAKQLTKIYRQITMGI